MAVFHKSSALPALFIFIVASILCITVTTALPHKFLGPHVRYVDDTTVDYYIENPRLLTYVYIYSHTFLCVRCQAVAETVSKIAKEFAGQIHVIALDSQDPFNQSSMARLGIKPETHASYPVLLEFPKDPTAETDPNQPGNVIDITDVEFLQMKKHVLDLIQVYGDVKHLDATNMQQLLKFNKAPPVDGKEVQQYGTPKAILITTKTVVPPIWSSLSHQLGDKMEFYIAQKSDRKVLKRFESGIPSSSTFPLIIVLRQNEFNSDISDDQIEPLLFSGPLKASLIRSFLSLYTPVEKITTTQAKLIQDPETGETVAVQHLSPAQNLEVRYYDILKHQSQFLPVISDQKCYQHLLTNFSLQEYASFDGEYGIMNNGLSLLLFLPRVTEYSITVDTLQQINYQIELFKGLYELKLDLGYTWAIIPATVLPQSHNIDEQKSTTPSPYGLKTHAFLKAFGLQEQDYPQIVIYSPRKAGFNAFMGSFGVENVSTWIADVTSGRKTLTPIAGADENLEKTLASSFYNITLSRCNALINKRMQEKIDRKRLEKADDFNKQENNMVNYNLTNNELTDYQDHRWFKPHRLLSKKGQIREMTDEYFYNTHIQRSITTLLMFQSPPDNSTKKHDFFTFQSVIEGLNGMVEGYYVQCNAESKKLRKFMGIGKNDCTGVIYALPPKSRCFTRHPYSQYYNATLIQQEFLEHRKLFEVTPMEVKSPTRTFSAETLRKFATEMLSDIKPYQMPQGSDALQTFLLKSVQEPKVLIFTKKTDIILPKALMVEFWSYASVAIVDEQQESMIHQFQITEFPSVRILLPTMIARPGGVANEHELKLDVRLIPKNQLYYNSIASHLDQVVSKRYIGATMVNGQPYEELLKEHPVETMFRRHNEKEARKAEKAARDEL